MYTYLKTIKILRRKYSRALVTTLVRQENASLLMMYIYSSYSQGKKLMDYDDDYFATLLQISPPNMAQ
jgi:hypothetical protein